VTRLFFAQLTALLFITISFMGCGPSPEAAERERTLRAIDALRDAPSDALAERRRLLNELERQATSTPRAVEAQRACVKAYRALLDGTEHESAVRTQLADGGTIPPSLLFLLSEAEKEIKQSAEAIPGCEKAVAELRLSPGR